MTFTDRQLALKSLHYRRRILQIIKHAGAGHTGGSLSCCDILNVLYNRILNVSPKSMTDPLRDRYIHNRFAAGSCGCFPVDLHVDHRYDRQRPALRLSTFGRF